ncbi:hypothetical protein U1Q18_004349 [Sarracenia purpurea var. burkii]
MKKLSPRAFDSKSCGLTYGKAMAPRSVSGSKTRNHPQTKCKNPACAMCRGLLPAMSTPGTGGRYPPCDTVIGLRHHHDTSSAPGTPQPASLSVVSSAPPPPTGRLCLQRP